MPVRTFAQDRRNAEIDDLHGIATPRDIADHDVVRLDVAVHEAGVVGSLQALADLAK